MKETLQQTRADFNSMQNMENYFKTHDISYVATDAIFINMNSGEETRGKEAIAQMLNYFYHVAFDAKANIRNTVVTEDKALLEADFVGRHIGEFANIQPTNKEVNVPLCVTYDLENGLIKEARIYMLENVLINQLMKN